MTARTILIAIGVVMLALGFLSAIALSAEDTTVPGEYSWSARTHNVGLLAQRQLNASLAETVAICGAIVFAAGYLGKEN